METVVAFAVIIGFLYWIYWAIIGKSLHARKLMKQYENAKQALRQDPKKAGLREAAFDAGRMYFGFQRGGKVSIYDEQRLSNDINSIQ